MSFHSFDQTKFDRWKQQLLKNYQKPGWDKYDADIQNSIYILDRFHTSGRNGYVPPRWQLIKAQLWVESGGPNEKLVWDTIPMQIGMPRDTGILDVLHHPHIPLIAPPELRRNFDLTTIRSNPVVNIQAGLTLLHLKMAFFSTVPKPPTPPIAAANTVAAATSPPASAPLRGKTRTAPPEIETYICGWRPFQPTTLYQQYNVGDGAYAAKLNFCMELIGSDARTMQAAHP